MTKKIAPGHAVALLQFGPLDGGATYVHLDNIGTAAKPEMMPPGSILVGESRRDDVVFEAEQLLTPGLRRHHRYGLDTDQVTITPEGVEIYCYRFETTIETVLS